MDGHERGRARCVDRQRRAAKAESVRHPSGGYTVTRPGSEISVDLGRVSELHLELGIVVAGDAEEYPGRTTLQLLRRLPAIFQGFPAHLQKQPLLRIEARCFARRDSKKIR